MSDKYKNVDFTVLECSGKVLLTSLLPLANRNVALKFSGVRLAGRLPTAGVSGPGFVESSRGGCVGLQI